MQGSPKQPGSWWKRNRGWCLCVLIPFLIFFACGAKVGWGFIERDAGRYARDFGKDEPESDFYYAAALAGGICGVVGAAIGLGGYGASRFLRRFNKARFHQD